MKDLIKENYEVTRARGLIKDDTKDIQFIYKIHEEFNEFWDDWIEYGIDNKGTKLELADLILTCLNFANHKGIDIEQLLKDKIEINKLRI